jgi:hypothetical protein
MRVGSAVCMSSGRDQSGAPVTPDLVTLYHVVVGESTNGLCHTHRFLPQS